MFRIGEFARFTRVSVKMLRHYDAIGLLRPAYKDPSTGYRFYRADQLPTLNRILLLRELGFGLDEIADALDADDEALYERRERELTATIVGAQAQLAAVRARRALLDDGPPADVVVRPVEAELVATLPVTGPIDRAFVALESYVREHGARADRPPMTLLDDESVTIAVPVSWSLPAAPERGVEVRLLPAVPTMACSVHNGGYGGLAARLQLMLRWLDATARRPAGPLREVYLRHGAEPELALPSTYLAGPGEAPVTELQVPVTRS